MITRIEATRYRCFDKLDVELGDFRVLVGANGSGKTTLLDVPVLFGRPSARAYHQRSFHRPARRASPTRDCTSRVDLPGTGRLLHPCCGSFASRAHRTRSTRGGVREGPQQRRPPAHAYPLRASSPGLQRDGSTGSERIPVRIPVSARANTRRNRCERAAHARRDKSEPKLEVYPQARVRSRGRVHTRDGAASASDEVDGLAAATRIAACAVRKPERLPCRTLVLRPACRGFGVLQPRLELPARGKSSGAVEDAGVGFREECAVARARTSQDRPRSFSRSGRNTSTSRCRRSRM